MTLPIVARRQLFRHLNALHDLDVSRFAKVATPHIEVWHDVEHQTVDLSVLKHVKDYLGT